MEIETFEVIDVQDGIGEADNPEEFARLTEAMGLTGQRAFVKGDPEEGSVTTVPYRVITRDENFAYRELCPKKREPDAYRNGPIPVRVLQVLEHARSTDFFEDFQIWSADSAAIPYPVLIGIHYPNGKAAESWNKKHFLLARWGAVLEAVPALLEKANAHWRSRVSGLLREIIAKAEADLATTERSSGAAYAPRDNPFYNGLTVAR